MSSNGLPVDGVVSVGVDLGPRSTEQATDVAKSSLSADSAAESADAAFKFSREAKAVSVVATDAAERAEVALENTQNIADANTYYTTPEDPDGTIAGLAGTPDGKSFRVGLGPGKGSKTYVNKNGVALEISQTIGADAVNFITGEKLLSAKDSNGKDYLIVDSKARLWLSGLKRSVQTMLSDLSSAVFNYASSDVLNLKDAAGRDVVVVTSKGGLYLPGIKGSIQDAIKKAAASGSQGIEIMGRMSAGCALYAVLPEGMFASGYQWQRDGENIVGENKRYYILQPSDLGKTIGCKVSGITGGVRVVDASRVTIGGIALESPGATGTLYEGFTLSAGDDFNTLDILSPANPLGRWITTRTYLNPPRGSDTILGTMYDADPAFTGFNDSNRGVPVAFDNMRADNSVLRLQARVATADERHHVQGNRNELAAMLSSVGAFSFFAGDMGSGECIIEWLAMFTPAETNPVGWHPSLWTQSSLPSYTYGSDEIDVVEGISQYATCNWNRWRPDGSHQSGGSLGSDKPLMDGRYRKITAVLSKTEVKIYIDDTLTDTTQVNVNTNNEPGYLLMSSHVYAGNFRGDIYDEAAWNKFTEGGTISIDWCRIWRKTGTSHIKPLVPVHPANINFGEQAVLTLPSMASLWGREDISEFVQCVMVEENEPGGSHTTPYNTLPPFVNYDSPTRQITVSPGYEKAGRINVVIYGYLTDGSSSEPARTYVNIGPNIPDALSIGENASFDLYAACDCGVLVTDGIRCTKFISVSGLPAGMIYNPLSGLLISSGVAPGTYPATLQCINSVGQQATKTINITVGD
ncbi:hypothetical protein [Serratia liquefaciens]|uniref:hypothetical protein n=1 Tax=Serratia liquefaciens TaxID=614 RepID=UPI0039B06447